MVLQWARRSFAALVMHQSFFFTCIVADMLVGAVENGCIHLCVARGGVGGVMGNIDKGNTGGRDLRL